MYGNLIAPSEYHPRRSVIGAVDVTAGGNVVLRIGEMWTNDPERGWQQTEHVVLKWPEVRMLIAEMVDAMPKRYGETFGLSVDRELAAELINAIRDGATFPSEKLSELRNRLEDFASAP